MTLSDMDPRTNMGVYRQLLFIVFHLTHSPVHTWNIPSNAVCEHSYLTLNCQQDHGIKIIYANYGRFVPSSVFCPYHTTHNDRTDCIASNSQTIVQKQCDGGQTCRVFASNSVFGDPCPNTYKYLEIEFECLSNFKLSPTTYLETSTSLTSEGGNDTITPTLICIIAFLGAIILTIVVCCTKRRQMNRGTLENEVPLSDPPPYTPELSGNENNIYCLEHTYEKLQKEKVFYEDIAEDLRKGNGFYENCTDIHIHNDGF